MVTAISVISWLIGAITLISSVQFSRSVVSDSLRPHESQHTRPPFSSPSPGVHSDSCPWSPWCHPAISSSVIPFFSYPPKLPASGSFPVSQLFTWGGQSTGVSALASFLPENTQDWSPLGLTGWTSLQSKNSQESSPIPQFKSINSLVLCFLHSPTLTSIHDHRKRSTRWTFAGKVMFLLFNMLSGLVITFLPRNKRLLWLQSPSAVILEPPKNKVWHCFHCFPIYFPWSDGTRWQSLRFLNVEL